MRRDIIDVSCILKIPMKHGEKLQMLFSIACGNYSAGLSEHSICVFSACGFGLRLSRSYRVSRKRHRRFLSILNAGNAMRSEPPHSMLTSPLGIVHHQEERTRRQQCENAWTLPECRIVSLERETTHKYQVQSIPNTAILTIGAYFFNPPDDATILRVEKCSRCIEVTLHLGTLLGDRAVSTASVFIGKSGTNLPCQRMIGKFPACRQLFP
ncbi:hypothetical protein F5146DRAFT_214968 [Armillaria mellea]|nr:hypothetical protein F5146DRAFT_214968 [Armillaria mellea]